MKKEKWKQLDDSIYEISSLGKFRVITSAEIIPQSFARGYRVVSLKLHGKWNSYLVQTLVAKVWLGPCPKGKEVNHKDLNKWHNNYKNLEYLTHQENIDHAYENGIETKHLGEDHGMAKLKEKEVKQIRKRHANGESCRKLCDEFGMSYHSIWDIVKGRTWAHI